MTLLTLKEVEKRTGFTPSALRTRKYRGNLPFPLYDGGDGQLRADESEVNEWIAKTKQQKVGGPK
jgi:predicted DNA-binding transcriptional regulator AlpA